jgi:CBS domain containing-hemolysin-like protein
MNLDLLLATAGKLLFGVFLIAMNAFFVAAELALVKVRETQLDALVRQGHRAARVARKLKENINAAIGSVQIGITLAGLLSGRFVEPLVLAAAQPLLRALGLADVVWIQQGVSVLSFVGMTFALIVIGEMVPKAIALRETLPVTLFVARPLGWFYYVAFPLIWAIDHSARWLLARLGIEMAGEDEHTSEELRLMFVATHRRERGTDLGRDIVLNSLDLRRRIVAEVMRPRREITFLNTSATLTDCLEVAERTRYSRFPLCENGDVDRTLGVVHFKDLFARRDKAKTGADLLPVARKLIFVPETARLEKLLQLFLERKLHFAMVVDEYGSTTGMVTLENVLEELVGQIQDEFDFEKPRMTRRGEGEWELDGTMPLFELAELTGETIDAGDVTTVSGWVTQELGGFPKRGERVTLGEFELIVEELDGLRVSVVALKRRPAQPDGEATPT